MDVENIWDVKIGIIGEDLRDLDDIYDLTESDWLCFDGSYSGFECWRWRKG